jgi:RNA-splicing ligase RtcB
MIELQGKYNTAKVFTDNLDEGSTSQIIKMMNHQVFKDSSVRIMPDCHLGKGSVIGFTASLTDKVIPNVIGVDIGCSISIGKIESKKPWTFETLDKIIRGHIPFGTNTHSSQVKILKNSNSKLGVIFNSIESDVEKISKKIGIDVDRIKCSIGSLGSGNHFIEIDTNSNDEKYLALHSGSRNFGLQVANYHQKKAINFIEKSQGTLDGSAKELAWLEGTDAEEYYKDMKTAQIYASLNRLTMQHIICSEMNWNIDESNYIESIHNYIDFDAKMIRKGAISAQKDEMVVVPISMGDGIIIGRGLGNKDWNFSCAHGAGRIYSRSKAKELLSMDEFKQRMNGIWSSCISTSTLDESPMSYKSLDYIVEYVKPTIEVVEIIKPVYNFKAN